jgi:hypothetical protein
MTEFIAAASELWRTPECRRFVASAAWLSAVSAGFWLLAKLVGAILEVFSELFFEELWDALATVYNVVLAVLFSATIFAAASRGAEAGELYLRRAIGFVIVYLVLSASYADPQEGEIAEHARPGWAMGLVSYFFFAAVPSLTAQPRLYELIDLVKAVSDSWVGAASAALVTLTLLYRFGRYGLRTMFNTLGPVLFFFGVLKHPVIRVRKPRG